MRGLKYYLGNPRLKAAGSTLQLTDDQLEELLKCEEDPIYFLENYYKIVHVDQGLIQFKPYEYQKRMVRTYEENRLVINLLPRQHGKSTIVVAYLLWYALFHDFKTIGILANKEELAIELLKRIKIAFENLPLWMQQGIVKWDAKKIVFENTSEIIATATTGKAARGYSFSLAYCDEYAFVQENIAAEFFGSIYPTISAGKTTKMLITSTPNGLNHFHDIWDGAKNNENGFTPLQVHYWEHPEHDEAWAERERKNLGPARFSQEILCEFLGGELSLINPIFLDTIVVHQPLMSTAGYDVYKQPIKDHRYVVTVDTAEGAGQDNSAFNVIDVTSRPYEVVAKYYSKDVSPVFLPTNIVTAARSYNDAFVLVEAAGVGYQVAYALWLEQSYPYVFSVYTDRGETKLAIGWKNGYLGLRMTPRVRNIGCANLKGLIEGHQLIFHDREIKKELSNFKHDGKKFCAEEGHHDDLVMSLVSFAWLVKQEQFESLTGTDFKLTMDVIEDRTIPFLVPDNPNFSSTMIEDGLVWETHMVNQGAFRAG